MTEEYLTQAKAILLKRSIGRARQTLILNQIARWMQGASTLELSEDLWPMIERVLHRLKDGAGISQALEVTLEEVSYEASLKIPPAERPTERFGTVIRRIQLIRRLLNRVDDVTDPIPPIHA